MLLSHTMACGANAANSMVLDDLREHADRSLAYRITLGNMRYEIRCQAHAVLELQPVLLYVDPHCKNIIYTENPHS